MQMPWQRFDLSSPPPRHRNHYPRALAIPHQPGIAKSLRIIIANIAWEWSLSMVSSGCLSHGQKWGSAEDSFDMFWLKFDLKGASDSLCTPVQTNLQFRKCNRSLVYDLAWTLLTWRSVSLTLNPLHSSNFTFKAKDRRYFLIFFV